MKTSEIELIPGTALKSSEQKDPPFYYYRLKSKEFMLHREQGLLGHITANAYSAEHKEYVKAFSTIYVSEIPCDANVISSHVLHKIKDLDDGMRICKARIALHGNKDCKKEKLKTDSASCPTLGLRGLFSILCSYEIENHKD